ncbi:antirestriction protein [Pseudomonas syringae pv. actinidiae]|nr:antirestriction protein [Pseudomonas syringae pv. actinidiae]
MTATGKTPSPITVRVVPDHRRMSCVFRSFGRFAVDVEQFTQATMRESCTAYTGGLWDYYELSNAGFFMVPTCAETYAVSRSNYFEGELSAQAVGIMTTLAGIMITWGRTEVDLLGLRYESLIDYARSQPEWALIRAALD